jgi:glycyl-tRNA synthetase
MVDYDTFEDHKVTVRDRDSMRQERVGFDALHAYLHDRL